MTENLDESHKLHKGLIFWVSNFHKFIFFGSDFSCYLFFLGIPKNAWAEPPCHVHVHVHSLGSFPTALVSLSLSVQLLYH